MQDLAAVEYMEKSRRNAKRPGRCRNHTGIKEEERENMRSGLAAVERYEAHHRGGRGGIERMKSRIPPAAARAACVRMSSCR